jgi:hypothetical protein
MARLRVDGTQHLKGSENSVAQMEKAASVNDAAFSTSCKSKFFYNRFCGGGIPHQPWGDPAIGENHEDHSQVGYGVGRRIFGIRFRRVGGVRRTGGANHAFRKVLPAV